MVEQDPQQEASEGLLGWARLAVEAAAPLLLFAWMLPTLLVIGLAEDPENKPPLLLALIYGAGWGAALVGLVALALGLARLWSGVAEAREVARLAAASTVAPADLALPATTWKGVRRIGGDADAPVRAAPQARAPRAPITAGAVLRFFGAGFYGLSAMFAVAIGGLSAVWEGVDYLSHGSAPRVDCEVAANELPAWVTLAGLPLREEVDFEEVEGKPDPVRVVAYFDLPDEGGPCVDLVTTDPGRIAKAEAAYALGDEQALREAFGYDDERPARVLRQWQPSRSWRALVAPPPPLAGTPKPPPEAYVEVTYDPRPTWTRLPLIGLPLGLFALGAWVVRLLRGSGLRLW